MVAKIQRFRITAIIPAGETGITAYSSTISGKILAVHVNYPTHECTVDLDTAGEIKSQKILDLALATADVVLYPRVALEDNTGAALDLSDEGGGDVSMYGEFVVHGKILLTVAGGTAEEKVVVDIIAECY